MMFVFVEKVWNSTQEYGVPFSCAAFNFLVRMKHQLLGCFCRGLP